MITHSSLSPRNPNNCWGTSLHIAIGTDDEYVGEKDADKYLADSFDRVTDFSKLQFGDIVRYEKSGKLTHFTTFLISSKEGDKYVFSKSGSGGVYEVNTDYNIAGIYPSYGPVEGYYSPK